MQYSLAESDTPTRKGSTMRPIDRLEAIQTAKRHRLKREAEAARLAAKVTAELQRRGVK